MTRVIIDTSGKGCDIPPVVNSRDSTVNNQLTINVPNKNTYRKQIRILVCRRIVPPPTEILGFYFMCA